MLARELARNGVDEHELDRDLMNVLTKVCEQGAQEEPAIKPYKVFEALFDVVFHIDPARRVLWYKSDKNLSLHIPKEIGTGSALAEYLPSTAYQSLCSLFDMHSQNNNACEGTFQLGAEAMPCQYHVRIIADERNGHLILCKAMSVNLQQSLANVEENRRYDDFEGILVRLNKKISTIDSVESLYREVAESARSVMGADRASVWALSSDGETLELKLDCVAQQIKGEKRTWISRSEQAKFFDMLDTKRIHLAQLDSDNTGSPGQLICKSSYVHSACAAIDAPMRADGKLKGLLRIEFLSGAHDWTHSELMFIASLSDLCAHAYTKLLKDFLESSLRNSERRFKEVTENSAAALFAFNDAQLLYVNPALEQLTGLNHESLLSTPVHEIFGAHFRDSHKQAGLKTSIAPKTTLVNEIAINTLNSERHWLHITTTHIEFDGKSCWLGSAVDISERKMSEARLKFQASHDPLTGLPNRAAFQERVSSGLARASRDRFYKFAVLYINIDRFKIFNDSMGQLFGDQLLLELSKRLSLCLESTSIAARISGDEFAVFLSDIYNEESVASSVEAIQTAITEPINFDGHETNCNASIGVVMANHSYEKPEQILRDASIAMYKAKTGENRGYRFFSTDMREHAKRILQTENELRSAIKNDALSLFYQPIVNLETGDIAYFEALIRWHKSASVIISPLDFIPLAEESGVIIPLGRWVVNEAGKQLQAWQAAGWSDIGMSINVSGKQFHSGHISADVQSMMSRYKLQPNSFKIEITESSMIQNSEIIQDQLQRLKELGCHLLVDDFGTGYSSLSYLHQFPIDCIKIDRSFTANLRQEEETHEIVRAITNLAHNLNLSVVAEGVETKEQAEILKRIGCDHAQGYYFSKPMRAEEALHFIEFHTAEQLELRAN